jgi:hypothetical protein
MPDNDAPAPPSVESFSSDLLSVAHRLAALVPDADRESASALILECVAMVAAETTVQIEGRLAAKAYAQGWNDSRAAVVNARLVRAH